MSPNEKPITEPSVPNADTAEALPEEALDKVSGGLFNTASDYVNGSGNIFGTNTTGGGSGGGAVGYPQMIAHESSHTVQQRSVP